LQELAITAAASIARYAWENGYHVGLYVNSVVQPAASASASSRATIRTN